MTKDEALRLALEVLADLGVKHYENTGEVLYKNTYTAIKAALEAKDEPAAWMYPDDLKRFETSEAYAEAYSIEMVSPTQGETVPLYTTPPQRKPLTDEEMKAVVEQELVNYWDGEYIDTTGARDCLTKFARTIEAAHGIKGENA